MEFVQVNNKYIVLDVGCSKFFHVTKNTAEELSKIYNKKIETDIDKFNNDNDCFDKMIDKDGNIINIPTRLDESAIQYPLWFKAIGSPKVARFDSLTTGEIIATGLNRLYHEQIGYKFTEYNHADGEWREINQPTKEQ